MVKTMECNVHSPAAKQGRGDVDANVWLFILMLCLNFWRPAFATEYVIKAAPQLTAARRAELITLVRQDCGSCHGLTLKGGLGPALLPELLKNKSADYLKTVILYGRPDKAMPPWKRFVSEAEVEWIVVNLQKGFPIGH